MTLNDFNEWMQDTQQIIVKALNEFKDGHISANEAQICEECPFGYLVANDSSEYLLDGCLLNELAPYQWGQIRISEKVSE
jgi:hypothetical protein